MRVHRGSNWTSLAPKADKADFLQVIPKQGDQIFAQWAIFYFGQFFFRVTFFPKYLLIWTKKATIFWAILNADSSGHPGWPQSPRKRHRAQEFRQLRLTATGDSLLKSETIEILDLHGTSMLAQALQIFLGKEHIVKKSADLHPRLGNLLQRNKFYAVYKTSLYYAK
jgi:hypothetical protein